MLGRVGVARPDVSRLELLELLLRAEFVGLCVGGEEVRRGWDWGRGGEKGDGGWRMEDGCGERERGEGRGERGLAYHF